MRKIILSHFPQLNTLLSGLTDHRKRKVYSATELICAAIGLFVFKEQSRNAINNDRQHSSEFCNNFEKLFECRLPHQDSVHLFFKTLPPEELERVKTLLIRHLFEKKVFQRFRIQGCFTIAFDASGVISGSSDRFDCGLTRESKNGTITYQYHVLEAKLVTSCGLCIPLATEWITNEYRVAYDKQDCEIKAFKRLAEKLKKAFPRLPVCVMLDALYANSSVMKVCQNYDWKYIITLKDGNLPGVQNCLADDPPTVHNSFTQTPKSDNKNTTITQHYHWVNDLVHDNHWFHYIKCEETCGNKNSDKTTTTNFVRITNLEVNADTAIKVSNAARLRWKIENEGFNTLKNGGYGMEHLFSRNHFNSQKNYYQCMLIAHIINQFLEHSLLIQDMLETNHKLTIKYLWQQLLAVVRMQALCAEKLIAMAEKQHQVRLYSG